MRNIIFVLTAIIVCRYSVNAQNNFRFIVRDSSTQQVLMGVTVVLSGTTNGCATGADGSGEIKNIPNGEQSFTFSYIGYDTRRLPVTFPLPANGSPITVYLAPESTELGEVVISSMRNNSRIEDQPQKVEVIGADDLQEESTLQPSNIASILGDVSVIHIQQTSQTNGNVAVRMEGLDGKYTQIMRDGIPAFGGFSGSFDVLSIPPLDLQQVEIVKGAASTLYGGGAIAGFINLISKTPADSNEYWFTANYTTLQQATVNGFFSGKKNNVGFTMFAGTTDGPPKDVAGNGFSQVPQLTSFVVHPRIFWDISKDVKLNAGYTGTFETRNGGDMMALLFKPDSAHSYVEDNNMQRHTGDASLNATIRNSDHFDIKAAVSDFDRKTIEGGSLFHGRELITYTEASYLWQTDKNSLVGGINYLNDNFQKLQSDSMYFGNYNYSTYGAFLQDDWPISKLFMLEAGMRADYQSQYRWFFLPRVALLVKPIQGISVRVSGGTGYNTPNIFADEDYTGQFNQLLNIGDSVRSEYAVGANTDINYHTIFGGAVSFEFNQAFYYTYIQHPLNLINYTSTTYVWVNGARLNSWGTDSYLRLGYKGFELYVGYNHTISTQTGTGVQGYVLLAPQDKLSNTLVYTIENNWRFGLEGSFIANQFITPDTRGHNYYLMAAMIEKMFGKRWSIILNGENLLNVRQSNFAPLYTGSIQNPVFSELYAPIEGWVVNLCVQLRL